MSKIKEATKQGTVRVPAARDSHSTLSVPSGIASAAGIVESPEASEMLGEEKQAPEVTEELLDKQQEIVRGTAKLAIFLGQYILKLEGRDRCCGPKPHDKITELHRQIDALQRDMANGFT